VLRVGKSCCSQKRAQNCCADYCNQFHSVLRSASLGHLRLAFQITQVRLPSCLEPFVRRFMPLHGLISSQFAAQGDEKPRA
jgi:hypothetical protein